MNATIERTLASLKKRGFDAYAAENATEASALVLSMIGKEETVTFGGSATLKETGIIDTLKTEGYTVYDRNDVPPAERAEFAKAHFFTDWYLMSSNAVTEEGELLNLDGIGNRVASLVFGPKNVIIVAGKNKIVPDMTAAYKRVRTVAAPKNAQRFPISTPCKQTGECADCFCTDTICASFVHTRFCRPPRRVRVILVNDDFGY